MWGSCIIELYDCWSERVVQCVDFVELYACWFDRVVQCVVPVELCDRGLVQWCSNKWLLYCRAVQLLVRRSGVKCGSCILELCVCWSDTVL